MMKKYLAGLTVLLMLLVACDGSDTNSNRLPEEELEIQDPAPVPTAYEGKVLVWAEEFEGNDLNDNNWSYDVGDGCPELCGWGNNELQYYTAGKFNTQFLGGKLIIEARAERLGSASYTSAKLVTRGKQQFKFGRIDVRAKLPEGQGIWPAFWMLPSDNIYGSWPSSGEIDIVELVGHEPEKIHGTVHFGPPVGYSQHQGSSYSLEQGHFSDDYHVFSIEWAENNIRWYVDDVLFHSVSHEDVNGNIYPFNQDFYFIINLAIGGNWAGAPDSSTVFPQYLMVDYIRVYQ